MLSKPVGRFAQEVAQLLPAIHRAVIKKQGDVFGLGKMTVPQYISLELIYLGGSLKMKDIARELKVSLPAASALVSRLFSMGLVERIYDKEDRRVIHIVPTAKGKRAVEDIRVRRVRTIADMFSGLTDQERTQYLRILKKLYTILYPVKK